MLPYELQLLFLISAKNGAGIVIRAAMNLQVLLLRWPFSQSMSMEVFPLTRVFLNFLFSCFQVSPQRSLSSLVRFVVVCFEASVNRVVSFSVCYKGKAIF